MARRKNDAYQSAAWMTHFLLERTPVPFHGEIFEPCCGEGAISNAFKQRGYKVLTADINPACNPDIVADYLESDYGDDWTDWVVTNPPFSLAYPMLLKAIREARIGVAFLLRMSFQEPTEERGEWLEANPVTGRITLPRYSFTGNGKSDMVTTEWMIWLRNKSIPQFNSVVSKQSLREWIRNNGRQD